MLLPTSELLFSDAMDLESGGRLEELEIAYETWGELNETGDNAVLVCHGYTNNQHAAGEGGWFSGVIGPGRAVDTDRMFVVAANMLGSAYGSTGPASIDPASGAPYGLGFPDLTVGDMVKAQIRLLEYLGVRRLTAVIGNSYGGHLAFQWGTAHPEWVDRLVVVVSAIKGRGDSSTVDTLINRFETCSGWNGGHYYADERGAGVFDEMIELRKETLRNYGYENKIRMDVGDDQDAIEAGLTALAEPWAEQFDANSLIVLRKAAVRFDARPNVAQLQAPVLYVLSRTDNLFPPSIAPATMALLADAGVEARYFEIDSDNGHRAPSIDGHLWAEELRAFMTRPLPPAV